MFSGEQLGIVEVNSVLDFLLLLDPIPYFILLGHDLFPPPPPPPPLIEARSMEESSISTTLYYSVDPRLCFLKDFFTFENIEVFLQKLTL